MSVAALQRPTNGTVKWVVARLERSSGFTRASSGDGALRIRVGDGGGQTEEVADEAGSLVTATLHADGCVTVETRTAPPALLVSRDGARLLPAVPGLCRPTPMTTGERLLLCSASALDSPPVGLVDILKAPARDVLRMSPTALLHKLLEGTEDGAAAVVLRSTENYHDDDGRNHR
jgi:hypothetical protein